MTLSDLERLSEIFNDMKHRAASLRQPSFLLSKAMNELDFANFRHGGANLTGFRLIDPDAPRAKDAERNWAGLSPVAWRGAGRRLQLDAALTMDGVKAIVQGLSALISHANSTLFRETFRRGQVYNNGTRGIQCKHDSPVWIHGRSIMNSFKQVAYPNHSVIVDYNMI